MVKITTSVGSSNIDIKNYLSREIDKIFASKLVGIEAEIATEARAIVRQVYRSSSEYDALVSVNGLLRADFGLPEGYARDAVALIEDALLDSIKVTMQPFKFDKGRIVGYIRLVGGNRTYNDVFAIPQSIVTTFKGENLPWLRWLLLFGDQIIIPDYAVIYGANFKTSRSGLAIMSHHGSWRVPPQYSGDRNNNWFIRVFNTSLGAITGVMIRIFEQRLS